MKFGLHLPIVPIGECARTLADGDVVLECQGGGDVYLECHFLD